MDSSRDDLVEAGMAHRAGEGGFAQHNGATLNINPNPSPCQSPTPTRTLTLRCTLPYSYLINIRQPQYDLQPQPYPPPFRCRCHRQRQAREEARGRWRLCPARGHRHHGRRVACSWQAQQVHQGDAAVRARASRALPPVKRGLCAQPSKRRASWVGDLRRLCAARPGVDPPEAAQRLERAGGLDGRRHVDQE